jgi:hypothetical protein
VIDAQAEALLRDIVSRESRSLLLYMGDAFPWTASCDEPTLTALRALVKTESAAIIALGRYLVRRRVPPAPLSSYPSHFTSYNFIALDYLLRQLVETQRSSITALERDLPKITDADAKEQVAKLLDIKRRHLTQLEALAAPHPEPAST